MKHDARTRHQALWPQKIVFMGERGDKIWNKNWTDVNRDLRVVDELYAGTSMVESRLRVGYILCPLPLFGALQWPSIAKISESADMQPYSVGGGYDRPIPRRIIEEAGVPRGAFGQSKNGAGFNYRFDNRRRLKQRMSPASYDSFMEFCKAHEKRNLTKYYKLLKFFWFYKSTYINKIFGVLKIPLNMKSSPRGHISNPGAPSSLFKWGASIMTERYARALNDREHNGNY